VSRFNISIILACVLLAMLLWIVRSTVGEWTNPQPVEAPLVASEEKPITEIYPELPVISSAPSLVAYLDTTGLNGSSLLEDLYTWRSQRGFPADSLWTTTVFADADSESPTNNSAELILQAGTGSIIAMHALAESSKFENPAEALSWFDMAMVNGSLHAMLRTADLLASLGDPALAEFRSGPVWEQALAELNADGTPPRVKALAWNIAAVTAGGYALLDANLADRITGLATELDVAETDNACELTQTYVLDTAMARRAQGGAVFSTERPLFAVSVAEPATILPCDIPVQPLVDMSACITETFIGPGQRLWQMNFCPSP